MDDMNETTNVVAATDTTTTPDATVAPKPRRTPKPRATKPATVDPTAIRTFADVVAVARTVTPANYADMLAIVNANHGVIHAARNVGRFTRGRIMDVQNETLRDNAEWQLDDCQLSFVWCVEFPAASGAVFTATPARRVSIVRGVRAEYNNAKTGHHAAKFPVTAESVRYGARSFDWPSDAAKTA